jgi:hypothetical protein
MFLSRRPAVLRRSSEEWVRDGKIRTCAEAKLFLSKKSPPQASLQIPLPFTVVIRPLRILLPPLFLVVRMFLSPLLLTFQGDLVILGVSHKLLAVIIGAALTLALPPTAHPLLRTISGG